MDLQTTLVLSGMAFGAYMIYTRNHTGYVNDGPKQTGYSFDNNYAFMSAMKHDMFKQASINIMPVLVAFLLTGSLSQQLFSTTDFFGSLVGRTLVDLMGYFMFYQIVQPYVANTVPVF